MWFRTVLHIVVYSFLSTDRNLSMKPYSKAPSALESCHSISPPCSLKCLGMSWACLYSCSLHLVLVKTARSVLSDWPAVSRFSLISSSSQDPTACQNSGIKSCLKRKKSIMQILFLFWRTVIKFQVPLLALAICLNRALWFSFFFLIIAGCIFMLELIFKQIIVMSPSNIVEHKVARWVILIKWCDLKVFKYLWWCEWSSNPESSGADWRSELPS